MRKHFFAFAAILLITLLLPQFVFAAIPDPDANFYVNDFAGVIEPDTGAYIVLKNQSLYKQTGAQVVIATVDFTDGKPTDEYCNDMFDQWGIGDKNKNNGVLLLLSIGDDDYYMTVGPGLKKSLPPSAISQILNNNLEADFAAKDYNAGVRKTFDSVIARLDSIYGTTVANEAVDVQPGGSASTGSTKPQTGSAASQYDAQPYATAPQHSLGGMISGLFSAIRTLFVFVMLAIFVILILGVSSGTRRRRYYGGYPTARPFWGGFFWPRRDYYHRRWGAPPPPPGYPPGHNQGWFGDQGDGTGHSQGTPPHSGEFKNSGEGGISGGGGAGRIK